MICVIARERLITLSHMLRYLIWEIQFIQCNAVIDFQNHFLFVQRKSERSPDPSHFMTAQGFYFYPHFFKRLFSLKFLILYL